jgi:hypothetical protein
MKTTIRWLIALAAVSNIGYAAPFLAVGDSAELFATGTVGLRADDNIFLANNATSDTIFDINPGLSLEFGKNADLKGSLALVDAFANYMDHSSLNTNLFSANFQANYDDGGKTKIGFNLGYNELNQNTVDTGSPVGGGLVRRDQFVTGAKGEVEVSQITAVGVGVNFEHMNYKRSGYGDSDTLTVPLNLYYKWTPKTDLSLGYRYRNTQVQLGQDTIDHFISVGARGEFPDMPKLKGEIAVGVNERNISGGASHTDPGLDARVTYEYSPKTTLSFNSSADYSTSPSGAQQKNFSLGGQVSIAFDSTWNASGGVSYRKIDYYTRKDDYWEATLGGGYVVNSWARVTAAYTYRKNDSAINSASFTNNVFSISASLRY